MKEILDFRVSEEWAQREFGNSLGDPLYLFSGTGDDEELNRRFPPFTRRIVLDSRDPRLGELKDRLLKAEARSPEAYDYAILMTRKYTRRELAQAERLQLLITKMFEPCGEDKGTIYDDSHACRKCGFGRVQRSPLRLNLRKVPKRVDIAMTIARSEWIVSERLADIVTRRRVAGEDVLNGFRLQPVEHRGRQLPDQQWYQLIVTGSAGPTVPPTRFGKDYLHDDLHGEYSCLAHRLAGLNLLSEVYLDRGSVESTDLAVTTDRFGVRRGVLMPIPALIISPRFYRLLQVNQIRGFRIEVAHVLEF